MTISASPAWWQRVCRTNAPAATVLIRCYAGLVFASEGVLKFLRPRSLGVGRFTQAGIAAPEFFAALDGVFEIGCGVLILAGLLTRVAAAPMVANMAGALLLTNCPSCGPPRRCSRVNRASGISCTKRAWTSRSCAAPSNQKAAHGR